MFPGPFKVLVIWGPADREGKILMRLQGGHVIEGTLLQNLRRLVNVNL